jgi:hypothetical protein
MVHIMHSASTEISSEFRVRLWRNALTAKGSGSFAVDGAAGRRQAPRSDGFPQEIVGFSTLRQC